MNIRRCFQVAILAICALILSAGSSSAAGKQLPKMIVLDLVPNGVSTDIAQSLTDLLDLEIDRAHLYETFSMQDLRAILKKEEIKQLTGAGDPPMELINRLSKAMDAPYLLRGSVGKVGSMMVVSLDIMDIKAVKVVRRVSQTIVGDESSLVGSLRAAALALALDEKGVTPDISEKLINDLKISEKPKKLFLAFSPGYVIPVGPTSNNSDLIYLNPSFLSLRLDVEYPLWKWIRLFGSTGYQTTIAEQLRMQGKRQAYFFNSAYSLIQQVVDVNTTTLDYSVQKIPLDIGIKFVPETGRFLPFALIGIGISWQQFSLGNEQLGFAQQYNPQPQQGCPPPYVSQGGICGYNVTAIPKNISSSGVETSKAYIPSFGFDFVAGAGVEWLLSQNLGFKLEVRYTLTYLFKSGSDLDATFYSDGQKWDNTPTYFRYGDAFPIKQIQHDIAASAGLIVYW